MHALFLEHGTKTCSRLPHGILLGITLEATRPSCCTRSLLWPAGQRQRIFKKPGAENKQVLLLLADFLCAAFGTLQTHCRKKEIWEACGPDLISDLAIQKALDLGFTASSN